MADRRGVGWEDKIMSQKNLKQFTLKCTYRNDLFYPPFLTPPPLVQMKETYKGGDCPAV